MIPATQLRIGNIIQVNGIFTTVRANDLLLAEQGDGAVLGNPVPLTKDVMLLTPYIEIGDNEYWKHPRNTTTLYWDSDLRSARLFKPNGFIGQVESLHELQNLHLAIHYPWGDELVIRWPTSEQADSDSRLLS